MPSHLSKPGQAAQVRTFVAVELPGDLQSALGALEEHFKPVAGDIKWVRPNLLHVTLHFLGNVDASHLSVIETAVRQSAISIRPFELEVSGLAAFPNESSPRVVWAGLEEDQSYHELVRLQGAIGAGLQSIGQVLEERAFHPHITLARARDNAGADGRRAIGRALQEARATGAQFGNIPVLHVTLMRSDVRPGGPDYTPIIRAELGSA